MKNRSLYPLAYLLFLLVSCTSDFISPDISKKQVSLLSPPDGHRSQDPVILFWCSEVKGASGYRLQIVDSSFSYVRKLVLDSLVKEVKFSYALPPGKYQWRMRAENNASATGYSETRDLVIDSTANLSGAQVHLQSPAVNLACNTTGMSFSWEEVYSAEDYRFQLVKNNVTVVDVLAENNNVQYTLTEGQYTWQVRAQNASSNSAYFSRSLTIDLTAPAVSTQSLPASNAFVASPVAITWARDAASVGDSLLIYPDSLVSAAVYKSYTTSTSYNYTGVPGQSYFWRLRSVDAAGNWSGYGSLRKFRVQ